MLLIIKIKYGLMSYQFQSKRGLLNIDCLRLKKRSLTVSTKNTLLSAKILLVPPKCEIITMLSQYWTFLYCSL